MQYLRGKAKELAESCSQLPSDEGYERAMLLLDKQDGDKYRILSCYRNELKYWSAKILRCQRIQTIL